MNALLVALDQGKKVNFVVLQSVPIFVTPGWHRELCKSCSFFKFIFTQFSQDKASAGMFSSPHLLISKS